MRPAATAPTAAAAGSVSSQASAIRPAMPQRTLARRRPGPEPMIEPEATCVVDSGEAEVGGGQDHGRAGGLGGEALLRLDVGQALAHRADDPPAAQVGAERDGQAGGEDDPDRRVGVLGERPAVISARVMMPIVFCASFVPWASETSDAEAIWPARKPFAAVPSRPRAASL